jgi:hypothetical protein
MPAATKPVPASAAPTKQANRIAELMVVPLRRAIDYAQMLVKDIPADTFAHKPHEGMNHPAFCIGHLSLYPNRLFTVIGRPELIVERPGYPELFQAGTPCVEQDGRYPSKDEITAFFFERINAFADALEKLPDDAFFRENPLTGRMKEIFPTVGIAVNFMANNHNMMHLGQVSAWRRAMGMPSVM